MIRQIIFADKVTGVKFVAKNEDSMICDDGEYTEVQDPNKATHIMIEFSNGNNGSRVILKKEEGNNAYLLADALAD